MPAKNQIDLLLWLRAHRGILSMVARKARVTPQFVRLVFWGKRRSRDGQIERLLQRHGASMPHPGRRVNVRAA
jgi:hypothetical protein